MKAPNGKDSNLPENFWLTVRTKAFKSWFGDWENDPQNASKVVDENGEPLVVYHGTNADFSIFEGQKIKNTSEGAGFYFTPNKNLAQGFGNIKATFLNIRNPQYAYGNIDLVSDTYEEDYEKENKEAIDKGLQEVKKKLEKKGYKFYKQVQKDLFDVIGTQTQEVLDGLLYLRNFVENENLDEEKIYNDIREAEKEVFKVDGYTTNRYGGDQKVYVAFTSNQIKSINNRGSFDNNNPDIYFQDAYHGTPHRFEEFSTDNIGTGEGAQAHGWGLYFAKNKDVSERYRRLLTSGNDVDFTSNKPISQEQKEYLKDLIDWTNVDNSNKDWYLKQLKNEIKYMQDMFTKTLNNAEQDKQTQTYLLNKLKEFDGEIEQFINALTNEELSMKVVFYGKLISVKDFFKQTIGAYSTKQDIIQRCNNQIDSDNKQIKKAKEILNLLKDIDLDSLNVQTKKSGQLFQVDIPENDVLLDEQKTFDEQPEKVQKALKEIAEKEFPPESITRNDIAMLKYINKYMEGISGNYNEQDLRHSLWVAMEDYLLYGKEKNIEKIKKEVVPSGQQVRIDFVNSIDNIDRFGTKKPIDFNFKGNNGRRIYNLIASRINGSGNSFRDASLLLNKYGIKGITYDGRQDGRAYVIFDDKAIKILEKYYQSEINKTIEQDLKNLGYTKDVYFEDREDKIDDKDVTKIQDFKDIVDSDKDVSFSISLGQTPKKLVESGAKQRELFVSKEIINKSQNKKNIGHDLDKEILKQVPEKLYNPIAVMKSRTVDNSLVVITELNDKKNNPVIIAIKLDNKGRNNNIINEIKTIHGRSGFENLFGHSLFEKKVAKIDIKKAKSLPTNYRAVIAQRVANSSNWILVLTGNIGLNFIALPIKVLYCTKALMLF